MKERKDITELLTKYGYGEDLGFTFVKKFNNIYSRVTESTKVIFINCFYTDTRRMVGINKQVSYEEIDRLEECDKLEECLKEVELSVENINLNITKFESVKEAVFSLIDDIDRNVVLEEIANHLFNLFNDDKLACIQK